MSWDQLPPPSTFEKARRKEIYRRFAGMVRHRSGSDLVGLDEVKRRLRLFEQTYVGVRAIPLNQIIGSADRASDFDRHFLPKTPELRQRWKNIEKSFPQGDFPPIVAFQIEDSYFVVDGHHRVAVAKARGMESIDAEITRLKPRFKVPPHLDLGKVIMAEQQRIFLEESGLERARPEASIEFSRPLGFVELMELIKVHGYHLMKERNQVLPIDEIAGDWYDRVYLPTVEAIRREGLVELFPRYSEADQFLWIYQHRRSLFPSRGEVSLVETVSETKREQARRLAARARRTLSRLQSK